MSFKFGYKGWNLCYGSQEAENSRVWNSNESSWSNRELDRRRALERLIWRTSKRQGEARLWRVMNRRGLNLTLEGEAIEGYILRYDPSIIAN